MPGDPARATASAPPESDVGMIGSCRYQETFTLPIASVNGRYVGAVKPRSKVGTQRRAGRGSPYNNSRRGLP